MSERDQNYHLSCAGVNGQDLVGYLGQLGFSPAKVRGAEYWYLSPLRSERTPSFKVNRKLNRWYDFGEAHGGSLIDFGIRYFNCSVGEFLLRMQGLDPGLVVPPGVQGVGTSFGPEKKLSVSDQKPLSSAVLMNYLAQRNITLPFC